MQENRRRRGRGALVAFGSFVAVCLVGTASGFAAAGPGTPPSGSSAGRSAACQSAPVNVTFQPAYDAHLGDYGVASVRLDGLQTVGPRSCAGHAFQIVLTDGSGGQLLERTGTVPTSGTMLSANIAGAHVPAASVASVNVTISD